ncbi:hypothetical protein COMA2_40115 [Candidatus Nitrospira nitrificans]|uniref:Uncharacterized protein n=1 Tax=Candidatus Nitrospira nitrificans TaxID=1742973 RepID=A0A0S4LPM1_9BACT|nr:hypothetical protein COMA2_40115 [Candidatus Nitrospira nitrificans]
MLMACTRVPREPLWKMTLTKLGGAAENAPLLFRYLMELRS